MFERYISPTGINDGSRGSLSEVWIDKEANLVKKLYKPNGVTIRNRLPFHRNMVEITKLYDNELYWTTKLKSKYLVETYEYGALTDEEGFYILQEWPGPDLLHYANEDLPLIFPNLVDQLEEMFSLFKEHNMYKLNCAKCNLTGSNGNLKCFDFKYSVVREARYTPVELRSITHWLSKIDKSLIPRLSKYVLL